MDNMQNGFVWVMIRYSLILGIAMNKESNCGHSSPKEMHVNDFNYSKILNPSRYRCYELNSSVKIISTLSSSQ